MTLTILKEHLLNVGIYPLPSGKSNSKYRAIVFGTSLAGRHLTKYIEGSSGNFTQGWENKIERIHETTWIF
jgi:hypothetical protein